MARVSVSYIGKGVVRARKGSGGLFSLGNVSKLDLSFDEDKKELKNYMTAGGGNLDTVSRISAVTLGMTCTNFDPETLAIPLRATVTAEAGGAVADEAHDNVILGGHVPFAKIPDLTAVITVKKGAVVLDKDVDYSLDTSGITIATDGTLVAGDDITVSYTALASHTIEALTTSGDEYELVFDGLNEARSGKAFRVTAFRCKFSPMSGFGLISDDFGSYEMPADVLADPTRSGVGISQYFKIKAAD